MGLAKFDFSLAIGGAAGQGIATPGNTLARIFSSRGLHVNAYNAYQSIVRGGHIFLTVRVSDQMIYSHGDRLDLLICLNQDTMNRHLGLIGPGSRVIFNSDTITPGEPDDGVHMCPIPVAEMTDGSRNKVIQNTVALGVIASLLGLDFDVLADSLTQQFQRKGQAAVDENTSVARSGFEYAAKHFVPYSDPIAAGTYSGTGVNGITVEHDGTLGGARDPDFLQVDIRFGYRARPGGDTTLDVFFDIFNITNLANFNNPSGNQRLSSFLQLRTLRGGSGFPRAGQFGIRFGF